MSDWNQLWSPMEAFSSGSLATSLRCATITVSSVARGALGAHKELRWHRVGRVRHIVRNRWLVSTYIVFESTTPVVIGKNDLQGLLIILLQGLLVFAGLGVERGYLVLARPNLQQESRPLNLQAGNLSLSLTPISSTIALGSSAVARASWTLAKSPSAFAFASPNYNGSKLGNLSFLLSLVSLSMPSLAFRSQCLN